MVGAKCIQEVYSTMQDNCYTYMHALHYSYGMMQCINKCYNDFILLITDYSQFLAPFPVFARFARRHVCTVILIRKEHAIGQSLRHIPYHVWLHIYAIRINQHPYFIRYNEKMHQK